MGYARLHLSAISAVLRSLVGAVCQQAPHMTMIIDSKQLAENGTTSLDPNAAGGVKQLSDKSLNVVMKNLGES